MENKSRMPQRKRADAVAEPIGCCGGTSPELNTADGCYSGTVKPVLMGSSDAVAEHLYIPGSIPSISSIHASPQLIATGIFQKGTKPRVAKRATQ